MAKVVTSIELDGEYSIHVYSDGRVVVWGCDCQDSLTDKKKIKELHRALGIILKKDA